MCSGKSRTWRNYYIISKDDIIWYGIRISLVVKKDSVGLANYVYARVTDPKNFIKVPKVLMPLLAQEDLIKWISKQ